MKLKLDNAWLVLLALLHSLTAISAVAAEVTKVTYPSILFTGQAEIRYPAGTVLLLPVAGGQRFLLNEYKGRWKEGLAYGYGELSGNYVITQSDNALYKQLQSSDTSVRGAALAILDRVRGDATFMKQDPEEAVRVVLGEKLIPVQYHGEFIDGVAMGNGELTTEGRKLKATFYQWLPEGLVTQFFGNLPVLAETYSKGIPSDGPILVNQYATGISTPSRRFVGSKSSGKISGDWYDVQWQSSSDGYTTIGMGDTIQNTFKDVDAQTSCKFDSVPNEQDHIVELDRIRGTIETTLQVTDQRLLRTVKSCEAIERSGWMFRFKIETPSPFSSQFRPPYSCSDPYGRVGVFSFSDKGEFNCNVTFTEVEYRWLSKIGREIERAARDVKNIILWPINTVGKAMADTMCDVVQKTPGKDCNINMSHSMTFEIKDSAEAQKQRAQEDLMKFLSARAALFSSPGPASVKGKWENSAKAIDRCASDCVGPARSLSILAIKEIQSQMAVGFDEHVKRYRLESFAGKKTSFFDLFLPDMPFVPPKMDKEAILSALSDVYTNSKAMSGVETKMDKYMGGIGAVMDMLNTARDYKTLSFIHNKIAWEVASLRPGETRYLSIGVTPGGDVSIVRVMSQDAHVLSQAGTKNTTVKIMGVMPSQELMQKLDKAELEKERRKIQETIDQNLQEAIQRSVM